MKLILGADEKNKWVKFGMKQNKEMLIIKQNIMQSIGSTILWWYGHAENGRTPTVIFIGHQLEQVEGEAIYMVVTRNL